MVELLIVIAILGILASGLLAVLDPVAQVRRARDSKRKQEIENMQKAFELYLNDANMYPGGNEFLCGAPLVIGTQIYMQKIPCDPSSADGKNKYEYVRNPLDPMKYELYACLENIKDPQQDPLGTPLTTPNIICGERGRVSYTRNQP